MRYRVNGLFFDRLGRQSPGYLWQGRYSSWYISDEQYLYDLFRYIDKSESIETYLEEKSVKSKAIKRAYRNKSLKKQDHKENYKHSKTRVRVG